MQLTNNFLSVFAHKETQRFKLKVGVFLFLVQNNNILLLRRYKTGIDDGNYVVPMGGINGNETLTAAIMREAYEETNIIVHPEDLNVCHIMHRFHPMPDNLSFEQIDIFFYAEKYSGIIKNREPHKCDELRFYPINDLPKNTVPFVRAAIETITIKQLFSEFGWESKPPHKSQSA